MLFPVVFSVVVLVVLCGFIIWFASWRRQKLKEDAEQEEVEREAIKDGIARKVLLPNGRPACIVCHVAEATETWPVSTTSWLDKVTAFKDLYALTPRYSVEDGEGERYELLLDKPHKRMLVGKWKQVHSSDRTRIQGLHAQIEAEHAQLEGGGMLVWAQSENAKSMARLEDFMGTSSIPQLTAPTDDSPISMPPMTTKASATETPTPNVEISTVHQNGDRVDSTHDE
jgi:hypothetical protein